MSLDSYVIVYSLEMVDGKGIVLPSAYICSKDVQGFPAYIQAAALPTNTESYGIKYHETIHLTNPAKHAEKIGVVFA